MSTTRLKDWLEISTEGFAARQLDRKPEHLLKEVIQNALDATEGTGKVDIHIKPEKLKRAKCVEILVKDNGLGITDPKDLRTVFSSGKQDSYLQRGRLGQGFKEILCLCLQARIYSGKYFMDFHVDKGQRVCDVADDQTQREQGTLVALWLPWDQDVIPQLVQYCYGLIVPRNRVVTVNDQTIPARPAEKEIPVDLKTELFDNGRWVRRERQGIVELVPPAFSGEKPMIFEMGIPVQEIDWTQPYHINVQMRIPMNPRRDAVAAGYLKDVYRQVLPVLMPALKPEELRDEWVSTAIEEAPPEVRQQVVTAAFGDKAVRAVPSMGRHDWNSDARELGYKPIDTSLLPKGLREATTETLQSSKQVELGRRESVVTTFNVAAANPEVDLTPKYPVTKFIGWLAEKLVGIPVSVRVSTEPTINGHFYAAAWSGGGRLILAHRERETWLNPLSPGFLGLLVHECAHEDAAHHGDDFREEVERMAGKLALYCLDNGPEIRAKYQELAK